VALLNSSLCLEEESNTGLSECWRLHKCVCVIKARINEYVIEFSKKYLILSLSTDSGLSNGFVLYFH